MARIRALKKTDDPARPPYRARRIPKFLGRPAHPIAKLQGVVVGAPERTDRMPNFLVGGTASYWGTSAWDPSRSENPDEVLRARREVGPPPAPYLEMLKNPYVRAAVQRLIGEILGAKFDVQAASPDPRDVEIADFCRWCLDPTREDFLLSLWEMLEAIPVGYSITAKIWDTVLTGDWAGKWYIREFRTKNPKDWKIIVDGFREVIGFREVANHRGPILPRDIAVLFTWDGRHGNPYGNAALQCVRASYEFLVYITKQRAKYLEHFSKPARIGKAGSNNAPMREEFFQALKRWGDEFVIVTPDTGWDVSIIEAVSDGGAFDRASEYFAREIAIGILGSHLQMMEGATQGSRAASETHADSASIPANLAWMLMGSVIGKQIIKPLVDWNYAGVTTYPRWVKVQDETLDYPALLALRQYLEIIQAAMRSGVDIGERWFRDMFNLPIPDEDDSIIHAEEKQPVGLPGGFAGAGSLGGLDQSEDEEEDEEDEDMKSAKKLEARGEIDPPIPSTTPAGAKRKLKRMVDQIDRAERMSSAEHEASARALLAEINADLKKKVRLRLPASTPPARRRSRR